MNAKIAYVLLFVSYGFDAILQGILGMCLSVRTMYWFHWISLIFSFAYSLVVVYLVNKDKSDKFK